MKAWFNSLPKREQILLIVASVLIFFFIIVNGIYKPVLDKKQRLLSANEATVKDIAWAKQTGDKIRQLRGLSTTPKSGRMSLSQMADQAAARHQLRIARFQPSGNNEAQIWLEKVEYKKVLAWLDQLESDYGLTIKTAAINSANVSGFVTARIRIKKGA